MTAWRHLVAEVVPDVLLDRVGQPGTPVVHGQQDRGDLELRVEVLPDQVDVVDQLVQALQRVVLALDRDQHLLRGDQRVDRQQAERGRAVDEDVVELPRVARRWPGRAGTRGPPPRPARSPRRRGRSWPARTRGSGCPRPPGPPRPAARCRSGSRRRPGTPAWCGTFSPVEALPCGSRSTTSTRLPCRASATARLTVVVVLPTPPFWFATHMTRGPVRARHGHLATRIQDLHGAHRLHSQRWVILFARRGFT